MATIAPTKAKRDENLRKLKSAVEEYGKNEKTRLEEETKYLRSVLEGRGASNSGTKNISQASELLAQAVTDFIIFTNGG